jgi:hypothetical protein
VDLQAAVDLTPVRDSHHGDDNSAFIDLVADPVVTDS